MVPHVDLKMWRTHGSLVRRRRGRNRCQWKREISENMKEMNRLEGKILPYSL
jgi:hypothetical protein